MISIEEAAELVVKEDLSSEKQVLEYIRDNYPALSINNSAEAYKVAGIFKLIVNSDVDNKEILQNCRQKNLRGNLTSNTIRPGKAVSKK